MWSLIFLIHLASCQYDVQAGIQCYDGSVLPATSRCNNIPECAQAEDEYGCPTPNAGPNIQTNLVRLPDKHQQKIYVNSYPDYQDYQGYQEYQQQQGKSQCLKITKKSHSTLRAKRATFTF